MSFVFTKFRIALKNKQSGATPLDDIAPRGRLPAEPANENPANGNPAAAERTPPRRLQVDTWDIHGAF